MPVLVNFSDFFPDYHRIFKRLANALIRLRLCAGWSEPLHVPYTTLLEISCCGSFIFFRCGFVNNGNGYYPTQVSVPECGSTIGIAFCDWSTRWDVYCTEDWLNGDSSIQPECSTFQRRECHHFSARKYFYRVLNPGGGGGGLLWNFYTYVDWGYFFGFKILNFNILGWVLKKKFFGIWRFYGYFFFWGGGGHHKIGLYLGVISMHFRVFS